MKNKEPCCHGESENFKCLIKKFPLLSMSAKHKCNSTGNKQLEKEIKYGLAASQNKVEEIKIK